MAIGTRQTASHQCDLLFFNLANLSLPDTCLLSSYPKLYEGSLSRSCGLISPVDHYLP